MVVATGNGAQGEGTTAKRSMAEPSERSPQSAKPNTKSTVADKVDATELLQSAVAYCRDAGIKISVGNTLDGGLILRFDGLNYVKVDGEMQFRAL